MQVIHIIVLTGDDACWVARRIDYRIGEHGEPTAEAIESWIDALAERLERESRLDRAPRLVRPRPCENRLACWQQSEVDYRDALRQRGWASPSAHST
ncbi:MAG TPA: hypothetical protein VD788_13105 [Candidatus Polarisedimenticolaceae bacterium]|nr:hypothetical protein [Candidatus Polarisedimenticolaceae bacterium]